MMAPTGTMPTMKLLVDTKSQRMLYAEAGEDAVDFLFSLSTPAVGGGGHEAAGAAAPPPTPAAAMFTVMDDLRVAPMSTVSAIARLSTLGVKDIGALQEKIVVALVVDRGLFLPILLVGLMGKYWKSWH